MPNRYSQYVSGANYSPESFRDMSVVPIALRQRHDAALAAQDDLLLQLNNIQVRDEDRDYLNQKREEITGQIETLTNKINTVGAGDTNLMNEFRNMKRAYNKEVSLAGGLGQAANIKQRIDQIRANYLDYGTKQGWSPETTQKNFELEYGEWKKNNPSSMLGTEGFSFGEFNPVYAPKYTDPVEILSEIQPLIGMISQEEAWKSYKPEVDPNTGQITFVPTAGSTLSADNIRNLNKVEDFINQKLRNPNSDFRQFIRYANPGVDEETAMTQFLSEADSLLGAMIRKETKTVNQIETPTFSKQKGDKSSSDELASLVSTPTGAEIIKGRSISDIKSGKRIEELEALEANDNITQEQINEKTQEIYHKYRIDQALKDPNVIREVSSELSKNGPIKNGNIKDYQDKINNYQKQISIIKQSPEYKSYLEKYNNRAISPTELARTPEGQAVVSIRNLNNEMNTYKEALDNAYRKAIPEDDLKYSRLYTIGFGAGSNEANEVFSKGADNYGVNWVTLGENSGMSFTLPGETEMKSSIDNREDLNTLREKFASGDVKFKLGGIVDMGATGSSQIIVNYTTGSGEKAQTGVMSIDYDNKSTDTSVIDNLLIEMQKTLDAPSRAVIQSIIDNKELKALSVDNKEFSKKGFSDYQSETIKKFSNQLNEGYRLSPEFKAIDYINYPGRQLNMVLNQDGFYQLYMKDGKNKETRVLSAGLWLKRKFIEDNLDKNIKTTDFTKATDYSDKRAIVSNFMDLALVSNNDGVIQIDGNSQSFNKIKNQFIKDINDNQNDINLQYELAMTFFDEIKNFSIAHRNKKRNL